MYKTVNNMFNNLKAERRLIMSESKVGGVRLGYESPAARIVAAGSGCVVRASGWTTTEFDWQGGTPEGGSWGGENSSSTSMFDWQGGTPEGGLWGGNNSSSASAFQLLDGEDGGSWGGNNSSSASVFEEGTGRW